MIRTTVNVASRKRFGLNYLPLLMSGRVRVVDAETAVSEALCAPQRTHDRT